MSNETEALLRRIDHIFYGRLDSMLNQADMLLIGLDGEVSEGVRAKIVSIRADLETYSEAAPCSTNTTPALRMHVCGV